ncbi:hypothetical protein Salat_2839900 [Sesamum alatum]|uniref:Gag-Pol polyprotein/retrotransposon n=1 Tax=Sesamum alatum TaxID=300844 RepID=A0AAE1XMN6_9LAMI|nr:hypothetical protein Salat_2839900 [Sesamum alatum]
MSIPLSFTTANSTIINHRPLPPLPRPSARFFRMSLSAKTLLLPLCSANSSHTDSPESSDFGSSSVEKEDGKDGNFRAVSSTEIFTRLKRYGIAGILSYGLLNTAYYLTTFLVVWFYVTPSPGRMGYLAAVERFLKVMAMVWAGSQVTKLIRAGGALALAPFVDRGLSWFTAKFGFKSQGKAFVAIAGLCFGLAFLMFVVVTLLSA